jgi:pimeloyl-ACP methyl ester carboxylesterase
VPGVSRFLDVNGVRLHFLEWPSERPPLVIVHGNTHCAGLYEPLGDRLAPDFHVVALDLRAHGLSERSPPYSWAALRDDVAGAIETLDLGDVLLVAHSRGGGAALLAAATVPHRVRGAACFEPNVPLQHWHDETPEERVAQLVSRALRRRSTFASRADMYNHFKGRGAFKDWRDEYLRAYVQHGSVENPDGTVEFANPTAIEAAFYEEIFDVTEWRKVDDCGVPVLVIFGQEGGRFRPGEDPVEQLRTLFRNVTVRYMPNATHSGPMEHPEEFERLVREFAVSLSAPAASAR